MRKPLIGRFAIALCLRVWVCMFMMFYVHEMTAESNSSRNVSSTIHCNLSFPQAAITDVNTIYIPFTLVGQLIFVEAQIDTVRGYFMFDTGSERLLLNKAYFQPNLNAKAVSAVGNTGMVSAVMEHDVDSIQLSQLVIRDVQAHLMDLQHIEQKKHVRLIGILGYNVYRDFELFFDFQHRVIVLSRVNKKGVRIDAGLPFELPYDSLTFELKHHLIVVETKINSVKLDMILDSGAELNLIDRSANRKVLQNFKIIKRVNLVGVGQQQVEVLAGTMQNLSCGNQQTEKMNTLLTSLDEINATFGVHVKGILGYEFMKDRRILINYQKRKLYFFHPVRS